MELEPIAQVHQTLLAMEARRSTMAQALVLPTRLVVAVSRLETMTRLAVAVSRLERMAHSKRAWG